MLTKFIGAVFAPKQPRGYTGRHRAEMTGPAAPKTVHAQPTAAESREVTVS